ncbi:CD209 antigen-like protein E isoform X1 [Oreochromis aureus]|uniref:CD209 antigen-like protein E isoform X1 n=1 Tax=Oreochromis aureus TaxID=47969 RepID=UPI001953B019|nr:CD209 antigen-like protein E isoform X1 [Oreochromis aureus]
MEACKYNNKPKSVPDKPVATPGTKFVKKSSYRAAVSLLGVLCLLLLTGLIILAFLFIKDKFQMEEEVGNLKTERDQLQKRVEELTKEKEMIFRQSFMCNWVNVSGSFYFTSSEKKSWQESRQDCVQRGADLVIISSQEEQNFVNTFKKRLWIGLTDSETEGTWKWVDGTPMNTSYWNRGEPNGDKKENCGHIDTYNSENSWNDAPCSILHFWICEKRYSP